MLKYICFPNLAKYNAAYYAKQSEEFKDKKRVAQRAYYAKNGDGVIASNPAYRKKRLATDPLYRLQDNLRGRLNKAVRGHYKAGSAVRDLGCSIEDFKLYLESKFLPGMSWSNWGKKGWHIDHIIPLSRFDLSNPDEIRRAVHFQNLQPMWWYDNLSKGNR